MTVAIKNLATQIASNSVTNADGFYIAPNLPAGEYQITVGAPGFATQVRSGIILTVGQQLSLNLTMKVGSATEMVNVTSDVPAVDLVNSTIGGVTNATAIEEIPLNGRSWTDLANFQPGVHFVQDQPPISAPDRVKRGLGLQLTISGGRPQQNNYLLDGVNINDYANAGPGSVLGGNLGTDAVAEFSVLTANYTTEYGRTSGGVISAITKSGSNKIHGTAYEYARNSALDAPNYFDVGGTPPLSRNQFGASIGGPIRKNKTFIFGNYEGVRLTSKSNHHRQCAISGRDCWTVSAPGATPDLAAVRFLNAFFPNTDSVLCSARTPDNTFLRAPPEPPRISLSSAPITIFRIRIASSPRFCSTRHRKACRTNSTISSMTIRRVGTSWQLRKITLLLLNC